MRCYEHVAILLDIFVQHPHHDDGYADEFDTSRLEDNLPAVLTDLSVHSYLKNITNPYRAPGPSQVWWLDPPAIHPNRLLRRWARRCRELDLIGGLHKNCSPTAASYEGPATRCRDTVTDSLSPLSFLREKRMRWCDVEMPNTDDMLNKRQAQ